MLCVSKKKDETFAHFGLNVEVKQSFVLFSTFFIFCIPTFTGFPHYFLSFRLSQFEFVLRLFKKNPFYVWKPHLKVSIFSRGIIDWKLWSCCVLRLYFLLPLAKLFSFIYPYSSLLSHNCCIIFTKCNIKEIETLDTSWNYDYSIIFQLFKVVNYIFLVSLKVKTNKIKLANELQLVVYRRHTESNHM
jgi:hypothetical protein